MASDESWNENPADAHDREPAVGPAALHEGREAKVQRINAEADARDDKADARDAAADQRDEATSLTAFLSHHDDYDAALKARRSAAVDRLDAKIDRTSSAEDRSELSGDDRG